MNRNSNYLAAIVLGLTLWLPQPATAQTQCELHLDDVRSELQEFSRRYMNDKDPKLRTQAAERLRTLPAWIAELRDSGKDILKLSANEIDSALS